MTMRSVTSFNDGWLFEGKEEVSLPHTAVELPFAYFDERSYQRPFTYTKTFTADPAWTGREVALVFDGAMANARAWITGEAAGAHADGYTPFEVRLTGRLKPGSNEIKVVIDGSENPANAPIGGTLNAALLDAAGKTIATTSMAAAARMQLSFEALSGIALWDLDAPNLYTLELALGDDRLSTSFGFREAEFTS